MTGSGQPTAHPKGYLKGCECERCKTYRARARARGRERADKANPDRRRYTTKYHDEIAVFPPPRIISAAADFAGMGTLKERANARRRHREHLRRATVSDVTPQQELAMRKRARKCPLCNVRLTGKPNLPNSKHLDHILPVNQGGTHTHGNVRIICADCNVRRPIDGSDYTGTLTLWAQGPSVVSRQRRCVCGARFTPASQRVWLCPPCTDAHARKAAELHASGLTWEQVAICVGFGSGEGISYAAERIGYIPEPVRAGPKPLRECPGCEQPWTGPPTGGRRPAGGPRLCPACIEATAWRAVRLRREGWTLRRIADELGYNSISSVTNLIKTVVQIESRMGRPSLGCAIDRAAG